MPWVKTMTITNETINGPCNIEKVTAFQQNEFFVIGQTTSESKVLAKL